MKLLNLFSRLGLAFLLVCISCIYVLHVFNIGNTTLGGIKLVDLLGIIIFIAYLLAALFSLLSKMKNFQIFIKNNKKDVILGVVYTIVGTLVVLIITFGYLKLSHNI